MWVQGQVNCIFSLLFFLTENSHWLSICMCTRAASWSFIKHWGVGGSVVCSVENFFSLTQHPSRVTRIVASRFGEHIIQGLPTYVCGLACQVGTLEQQELGSNLRVEEHTFFKVVALIHVMFCSSIELWTATHTRVGAIGIVDPITGFRNLLHKALWLNHEAQGFLR
jgi:hypothetical protein